MSDEECMQGLIEGLKLGGMLGDVMGDTFDKTPNELTKNPIAVDKLRKLIEEIHNMGKKVMMSSHLY